MSMLVCSGTQILCSCGASPSVLTVTGENKVIGKAPIACVKDMGLMNIGTFGMCSSMANPQVASATAAALGVLTPQPCIPAIVSPWSPPIPKVIIGNAPAISMKSQLICSYGGIIQLISPVQTNLMAN